MMVNVEMMYFHKGAPQIRQDTLRGAAEEELVKASAIIA
jgi:hypothetical protein